MTDKQARFIDEYLVDLSATQAAIRAGYSERTAGAIGFENLRKPEIAEAIAARQAELKKKLEITQERVLQELAIIGFSDVQHYSVDDSGNVTLAEDAPEGASRALSGVDRSVTYTGGDQDRTETKVKIRLWNKNTALQDLGKHLGMFGPSGSAEDPLHLAPIQINVINKPDAGS